MFSALDAALKFGKLPSKTLVRLVKTLNKEKEMQSPKSFMRFLVFLFLFVNVY